MNLGKTGHVDKYQNLILSIAHGIAVVQNREDLDKLIRGSLSAALRFKHSAVFLLNDDGTEMVNFLEDYDNFRDISEEPIFATKVLLNHQTNGDPAPQQLSDFENLAQKEDFNPFLTNGHATESYSLFTFRLLKGDDVIGLWLILAENNEQEQAILTSLCEVIAGHLAPAILNIRAQEKIEKGKKEHETNNYINLVKDIYQLSTAVSNFMVSEQITKVDNEKTQLLAFSNAIASVKTIRELSSVINIHLTEWGIIAHYCMHIINDDKVSHSLYLYHPEATWTKFPQFKEVKAVKFPIADGIMDRMLQNRVSIYDLQQYDCSDDVPTYLKYWKLTGMMEIASMPVSIGNEPIGMLILKLAPPISTFPNRLDLLTIICSQIANTLSNILANEKINKQLAEIDQYKRQLEDQTSYLKEEIEITQNYGDIIGESVAIRKTFKLVSQVAMSDSTVLIQGETGTGKELIARAIHNSSPRKDKLMVKVNCAALSPNLIESELFGHERGSFTGATEQRIGKFELANNSTLFLDEVGEIPLDLQAKILRALQEKEIERVGGNKTIKVNVRIVAATNRDLVKEVAEGRFRSDLYYRLNIFPISLPPLRERKEDIPLLAAYFVRRFAKKAGREITNFSDIAMQHMMIYNWPGNIRELEHVIERCVLLSSGDAIKFIHLLPSSRQASRDPVAVEMPLKTIDENERDHILRTLKFCGGKISGSNGAASILGVPAGTLYSKMKKLGIKREHSI